MLTGIFRRVIQTTIPEKKAADRCKECSKYIEKFAHDPGMNRGAGKNPPLLSLDLI
jgi:hypothetical protein